MRSVILLGSTGSIGRQTLDVIRAHPDEFCILGMSGWSNEGLFLEQAREFGPQVCCISDRASQRLLDELKSFVPHVLTGSSGLCDLAQVDADVLLVSVSGVAGFEPVMSAARRGRLIALANKESVVAGGAVLMDTVRQYGSQIVPVDSEHSAIFQCLLAGKRAEVRRLILTASGGPFRGRTHEELALVSVPQALSHPNWSMGRKITIDSATLMNKGLEVIEAHHLFGMPYEDIDVTVHPQSIVHSMVEFIDGSVISHMGVPDMRIPIQYALGFPDRKQGIAPRYVPWEKGTLTFEQPDTATFPLLRVAYEAGKRGGYACAALSGANEICVERFLSGEIRFLDISRVVESVVLGAPDGSPRDMQDIIQVTNWAREMASGILVN